jgi:hypothetical protein
MYYSTEASAVASYHYHVMLTVGNDHITIAVIVAGCLCDDHFHWLHYFRFSILKQSYQCHCKCRSYYCYHVTIADLPNHCQLACYYHVTIAIAKTVASFHCC